MQALLAESVQERLLRRILIKRARIGIIGLGYVGLPLALAFSKQGFDVVGLEAESARAAAINEGRSYVGDVAAAELRAEVHAGRLHATTDAAVLESCDCIIICVPTPLSRTNDPDLSYIENAAAVVKRRLKHGQLVVLESTTYPGCTEELLRSRLEQSGLKLDDDFLLAFSPERVDPGNAVYTTSTIPRIIGGCSAASSDAAEALYRSITPDVHVVSSPRIAETAKLLENTFRAVNIGLVNELTLLCGRMNVDIWEVIEAARTKPYGFMPFYPGPGIGGHCIPLDPAYLSWRGRQFGFASRFIDIAQQINGAMPGYVVQRIGDALNESGKPLSGSRVLILGVSYKKDVSDVRESPALEIIRTLSAKNAIVSYSDPLVPQLDSLASEPLTDRMLADTDCAVIVTDHSATDYAHIVARAPLVLDTRHAINEDLRRRCSAKVVRL